MGSGNVETIKLNKGGDPKSRVAVVMKIDDEFSDMIRDDSVPGSDLSACSATGMCRFRAERTRAAHRGRRSDLWAGIGKHRPNHRAPTT
jgi:hypothetical protein